MYQPNPDRYRDMPYVRLGASGVRIAPIALGLWQNFGDDCRFDVCRDTLLTAFWRRSDALRPSASMSPSGPSVGPTEIQRRATRVTSSFLER